MQQDEQLFTDLVKQHKIDVSFRSPAGTVVHTGDFKVDFTPVFGDPIDLARFAEIGRKGVLALMCDSTNAERPGYTASERTVGKAFDTIFSEHAGSRIIVATFASNVDRVQQIIDTAFKYHRKVVIEGRSMINVISTAQELGYIKIPENTMITLEEMKNYTDEQLVLITTGSQGESMAALSRMASGIHKKVQINPGDTIVFSSHPIPGNEKNVSKLLDTPLEKMQELDDLVVDVDIELDDDPVEEFIQKYETDLQRMQDLLADLRDAAIAGLSDAIQELADQFMGLSEINPGKVVQALLTPLADMAIKEGEILIAQGIGIEACKSALEQLNGWAAVAAGTALVAIGAAAKSGLQALAKSGAGTTATTSYGGSAGASDVQTIQTELTVYVTGLISGNDILLSGQKTMNGLNR